MHSAKNKRLDALLEGAEQSIAAHWERCRDSGVAGASQEATDRIDARIRAYFNAMKAIPDPAPEGEIIEALVSLYDDLEKIDWETGGGLLEEAERDLLEPLFLNAAEIAGLDPHKFPRREPAGRSLDFSAARER
ncbi:MAG: hypothetical protein ACR650_16345 [Methylocystis sp.]|jgi:hypothetical protein